MKKSKKSKGGKHFYKMIGCSRKNKNKFNKKTPNKKTYLGGTAPIYPIRSQSPNPYTNLNSRSLKGGSCGCGKLFGGSKNVQNGGSSAFVGSPWTYKNWPSENNGYYYPENTYKNDVQLQIKPAEPNPSSIILKGGKNKTKKTNKTMQKGGNLSNFLYQDLLNLGRNVSYNVGSAYNTLIGTAKPVNPMPWEGQLSGTTGNRLI
jgi:hypothetical protein